MGTEIGRRLGLFRLPDVVEAVRLSIGLCAADVRLRLFPGFLNRGWLFPPNERSSSTPGPVVRRRIAELLRATRSASSRMPGSRASCLRSALALRSRLARMGVHAHLAYGVRAVGGSLQMHAWLEIGDLNVDPFDTSSFGRFAPAVGAVAPQRAQRGSSALAGATAAVRYLPS